MYRRLFRIWYNRFKGRSCWLRPKAHIIDYPLGNPYDILEVLLGPPYGPYKGPLWPYNPQEELYICLQKEYVDILILEADT